MSSAFSRPASYTPSRFNPSHLANAEYAARAVECAKRNADKDYIFQYMCRFAWSLCYTRAMRLEDAAYTDSNLWG